jgi:hypothetical protein
VKSKVKQQKNKGTTFLTSAVLLMLLCLSQPAFSQSLKIDFTRTGYPVQAGWQGYFATHEVLSSFTTQSYSVFGTTVYITPTWVPGAVDTAAQMYDRGGDDGTDAEDLLRNRCQGSR